jgi:hypothetical protein
VPILRVEEMSLVVLSVKGFLNSLRLNYGDLEFLVELDIEVA